MRVTKQWVTKHRTTAGSWTKSQIEAIGVDWPPSKGWISRVAGTEITQEQKDTFMLKLSAKGAKDRSKSPKKYDVETVKCQMNQIRSLNSRINKKTEENRVLRNSIKGLELKIQMLEAKKG